MEKTIQHKVVKTHLELAGGQNYQALDGQNTFSTGRRTKLSSTGQSKHIQNWQVDKTIQHWAVKTHLELAGGQNYPVLGSQNTFRTG